MNPRIFRYPRFACPQVHLCASLAYFSIFFHIFPFFSLFSIVLYLFLFLSLSLFLSLFLSLSSFSLSLLDLGTKFKSALVTREKTCLLKQRLLSVAFEMRHSQRSPGHARGVVEGAAEARADGEQPGAERADEVLARARRHDRVVRAGHLPESRGVQYAWPSSLGRVVVAQHLRQILNGAPLYSAPVNGAPS